MQARRVNTAWQTDHRLGWGWKQKPSTSGHLATKPSVARPRFPRVRHAGRLDLIYFLLANGEISPGSSRARQEPCKRSFVNGNLSFTRFCSATESRPRAHLFRTQLPFMFSFFPRLAGLGEGREPVGSCRTNATEARERCLASRLGPGQAECK